MSFETDIKKLQKLWDGGQDNTNKLQEDQNLEFTKNQQINTQISALKTVINSLNDIGGDYKNPTVFQVAPYNVTGFKWTITQNIPESWISNIRIEVGYKYSGNIGDFNNIIVYYNKVLNIIPVGSNGLVTATWEVGLYCVSYNSTIIIPDFQAKLSFVLINPSLAI